MGSDSAIVRRLLAAATLLLVGVGAFAYLASVIALGGLGALSKDLDVLLAGRWLWESRADPDVSRWLTIGAFCAATLLGPLGLVLVRGRKPPLFGDARWANAAEVRRAGLFADEGIVLGRWKGRPLVFGGDEHVLLAAPTRSGKGVGLVIPNLLTWPGSIVVLDVKRENWTASAGFRKAAGQRTILFDPLSPDLRTARFNPLGHIDRADPVAVIDELQRIASMLFVTGDHAEPFWTEAARTGFIGVGAYVAETPELNLDLGEIYRQLSRSASRAHLTDIQAKRAQAGRPLSRPCADALSDFCSTSDNTFASVRQTITSRMGLWLNPRVCEATSASDFDLRDLRKAPMSLYLAASPEDLPRLAPLMSLLFQQLVDQLTRAGPVAPDRPLKVLLLLDEFAQLGPAKSLAKAFSYVAAYGVQLMPVLQSPAQLRAVYGPSIAQEIVDNCGVEVAFAPKDLSVAQSLSERLGYHDIKAESRSRPAGLTVGRRSITQSVRQRALMSPHELLRFPTSDLIIMQAGARPVRGRKIVYWREQAFRARLMTPPAVEPLSPPEITSADQQEPPPRPRQADAERSERIFKTPPAPPRRRPPTGCGPDEDLGWVDDEIRQTDAEIELQMSGDPILERRSSE